MLNDPDKSVAPIAVIPKNKVVQLRLVARTNWVGLLVASCKSFENVESNNDNGCNATQAVKYFIMTLRLQVSSGCAHKFILIAGLKRLL